MCLLIGMLFIFCLIFITRCDALKCSSDSFKLANMTSCHLLLTCHDIKQLKIVSKISVEGNVKDVFLSRWGNYDVVLLKLKDRNYVNDFKYGLKVLQHLNNDSEYVVQLIGECSKFNSYVTKYHIFGDGRNLLSKIGGHGHGITFCINYVEMLNYMHHNNPLGRLVLCDSNDLMKLLSQILVTNELRLIINDMDAVAIIHSDNQRILCGCRNLTGNFVAPEQLHIDHHAACFQRYGNSTAAMTIGYNEKIDIWKIPDVCDHFVNNDDDYQVIKYHLFDIHKQCKNKDFRKRPTTMQVLKEYKRVMELLYISNNHDDL